MPNPILARVLSGTYIPAPSFSAPLLTSIVPDISASGTTITYTRATVATGTDHEGRLFSALSGEARFTGARRVGNLLPTSNAFAGWSQFSGTCTITQNQTDPFGAANTAWTFSDPGSSSVGMAKSITLVSGRTYRHSSFIKKTVGPPSSFPAITAYHSGANSFGICVNPTDGTAVAITSYATGVGTTTGVTVTSFNADYWRASYSFVATSSTAWAVTLHPAFNASGDGVQGVAIAGTSVFAHTQLEDVTGQSYTAAGEYVSVGNPPVVGSNLAPGGGTFDSSTGYTLGDGWSISGGVCSRSGAASFSNLIFSVFATGRHYCVEFDVTAFGGAGALMMTAGGAPVSGDTTVTTTGRKRIIVTSANGSFYIQGTAAGTTCTIDNLTVYETLFHGCGVDGVKYFNTDYAGTPIPSTTLLGYLPERAGTQILATADIRDMTTANWTLGATMTRARTSTGADGLVNTATRLTGGAVSATNTITTLITAAASSRTFSAMVKRITGTGPVRLTQDGFATNTDISSQLISGKWVLVSVTQSQLNAVMGIKIDTNGDAVDVDFNQFEAGSVPTSRMVTTGAARNADYLGPSTAGNVGGTVGAVFAEVTPTAPNGSIYPTILDLGNNRPPLAQWTSSLSLQTYDGTTLCSNSTPMTSGSVNKVAATWGAQGLANYVNGNQSTAAFDGDMDVGATMTIGNHGGADYGVGGPIRNLKIYPIALTTAQVAKL